MRKKTFVEGVREGVGIVHLVVLGERLLGAAGRRLLSGKGKGKLRVLWTWRKRLKGMDM